MKNAIRRRGCQAVLLALALLGTPTAALTEPYTALAAERIVMAAPSQSGIAVTSVTLINADTDKPISGFDPLANGATLNLATLPTRRLNLRINTSGKVGSVKMVLDGGAIKRTENVAPYALAGDDKGDYAAWTPAKGSHTLVATAYSNSNASGTASAPLTFKFTVVDQAPTQVPTTQPTPSQSELVVTSVTLINADTDKPISGFDPLANGTTLNLATLPTRRLNLRINTSGKVGSVKMVLDGGAIKRTENVAPYALAGDDKGDYAAWTPAKGSHTLVATAYSKSDASGTASASLTLTFTVVDQVAPTPTQAPTQPPTQQPTQPPATPTQPPAAPAPNQASTQLTFAPQLIPLSEQEIVNPFRGMYKWMGNEQVLEPFPRRSYDAYKRYQWRQFEAGQGQYSFSLLESDIAQAASEGRKYGFRLRALVENSGTQVPDYLMRLMPKGWWANNAYVPDWNDPDFLARLDALLGALAARYDGDPRLGYIDIGIYGNWGEWHMHRFSYPSSTGAQTASWETKKAIIDLHVKHFKRTPLLMMTDDRPALVYALSLSPKIGWRRDSLGNKHFDNLSSDSSVWNLVRDRWKTAPVVVEFHNRKGLTEPGSLQLAYEQVRKYHISLISNGNAYTWSEMSQTGKNAYLAMAKSSGYRLELNRALLPSTLTRGAAFELRTLWTNVGVAPTYEPWRVTVQLRNPQTGAVAWESASSLNLNQVRPSETAGTTPTPLTHSDNLTLGSNLPAGTYNLAVVVRDPQGRRVPLALAIRGRQADGSYTLGSVTVQ